MPRTETGADDRRSLHERIAADLRDEIMSGELAPGAKLPSTTQLKDRFDASSATVQKALQLLKDERLVVGRAGAAVTVREHRQRTLRPAAASMTRAEAGQPYPWLTEIAKHGSQAHSTLLEVTEKVPPADVAAALELAPGATAVLRRQLLAIDDEPLELVASYYPTDLPEAPHSPNPAKSAAVRRPCSPTSATHRTTASTESPPESRPRNRPRPYAYPETCPSCAPCASSMAPTSARSR